MNEKTFTLDDEENGLCRCILVDGEEMPTCEICELLNEQQNTIKEQTKQIEEWEFSFRTELAHHRVVEKELQEKIKEQQKTIKYLKEKLYDFEKRKIIEESEIDEDVIPKVKILRTELFGEKYE